MQWIDDLKAGYQRWVTLTPNNLAYDRSLVWLFLILLFIGFIMVSSASISVGTRLYNDPFYFSKRDLMYVGISLFCCFFFLRVPMQNWQSWQAKVFFLALFLLLIVLIPGIGVLINGARRWLNLGFFRFQPAEFAKFALICFLAGYFTRRYDEVRSSRASVLKPFFLVGLLSVFLLSQPDLGSAVVLFVISAGMLWIVGAKFFQFVLLLAAGFCSIAILAITSAYRFKRLTGFLDPFADPYGDGFQLSNSLMAFGRGEFFGEGLGNSIQKLEYLPEAHTDFVLAVLGEEFGFMGVLVMIILLSLLTLRAVKIGRESLQMENMKVGQESIQSLQRFKGFFAFGISIFIAFQGFYNLGMTLGMLPVKGLTFPLVSYGGSSLIMMAISIAVLIRIDFENRSLRSGHAQLNDD